MSNRLVVVLTEISAVGAGVVGGVFFAFSVFVMKGLERLRPAHGMPAMQAINTAAPSPLLVVALIGTALTCAVVGVSAAFRLDEPAAVFQLIGAVLYVVAFVVTVVYHIPHNDALGTVDPTGVDAATTWADYVSGWNAWNHVRAIAAISGAALLTIGVRLS